ncbi:MAG: sulfotransferase domain-containing protein [Desulfobacula sp.]|nr:sulfotransferase domain-containing protein [Desulfobacula sp.]
MKSDFLIIGFPRCGTTWLFRALKPHPDICMSTIKELNFFNKNYDNGVDYYDSFFEDEKGQTCGEASPNYIFNKTTISNIKKQKKKLKFIVILRHPVMRAFSAYRFFNKQYSDLTFEQAIKADDEILKFGQYIDYLKLWYEAFEKSQFKIIIFEKMITSPFETLKEVVKFLELDSEKLSDVDDSVSNPSILPKFQAVLYQYHLDWIIELVKNSLFDRIIRKLYLKRQKKGQVHIKKETFEMLSNHYRSYNLQLKEYLKLDLSSWE